jgi:hypothetical protein
MAVTPVGGVAAQPSAASMAVTPVGGVAAQPSAASMAVTPVGGVAAQISAVTPLRSSDDEETTSVGNLTESEPAVAPSARTTMIGQPAVIPPATVANGAGPSSVSLEALAAAAAAEDAPELEPSQSGDDLAIPMFAPEPSVVIASERSEPVRLPEPPQVAAPLPPPPRPRTQPVPIVAAPQPMVPQPPVLPPAPQPAPPKAPVAIGTQPIPPMQTAPAAPRDERWTQTDSLPIVRPPVSRKLIAIIGGGLALVTIVVVVIATRGPSKQTTETPVIAKHDPEPKGSAVEPAGSDTAGSAETPETGSGSATAPDPIPTGNPPVGDPPPENPPTGNPPTGNPPTGRAPTGRTPTGRTPAIGKNPKLPNETPGPVKTGPSPETLAAARSSYEAGNSKLFSGDVDGAIAAYKQTLALSPGYAAGYRGLGLAYAQQGNKAKALQALRTYLGAAPNAKDADLIRKRIAALAGG